MALKFISLLLFAVTGMWGAILCIKIILDLAGILGSFILTNGFDWT